MKNEMRTIMIILGGLLIPGLCLFAGRLIDGTGTTSMVTAIEVFIPICLGAALLNNWGWALPGPAILLAKSCRFPSVIFAVSAAVALFIWWKSL